MTAFIVICAAMVLVAVGWTVWPVLKPPADVDAAQTRGERRGVVAALLVLIPLAAFVLYANLTTWKWNDPEVAQAFATRDQLLEIDREARENPNDPEAWTAVGRAYGGIGAYDRAIRAFERAYRLTQGRDADVISNLGEALVLSDADNMEGRAGQLFEEALALAPTHPKALFYGSVAAMRSGDLGTARDRLQALLAQNPPESIRPALQRQIQDLEAQMAEDAEGAASPAGKRVVRVNVKLAPALQQQAQEPRTLFVIARDAKAGGPPLAVERHTSDRLPLTIELSADDAMMPSRTIEATDDIVIVARLSKSGTPQQQAGDLYGETPLQVDPARADQTYNVDVTIDRQAQ